MSTAYKVGFFITVSSIALGGVILYFGGLPFNKGHREIYYAYFKNVAGLAKGSDVRVAGVKVGKVDNFIFEKGKVKVVLELYQKVPIYKDAKAEIKSLGILGDKYVEIDPGHPESGILPPKSVITKTITSPSISQMVATIQEAGESINNLARQLSLLIETNRNQLEELINNLNLLALNLNLLLKENRQSVNQSLENIQEITNALRKALPKLIKSYQELTDYLNFFVKESTPKADRLLTNLNQMSETLKVELPQLVKNLNQITASLASNRKAIETTIQNLNEISSKINRGQGSLGKLINDDSLYWELKKSAKTLGEAAGIIAKTRLHIESWGQYETEGDSKAGINVILQPSSTHYYLLGIVGDSAGKVSKKIYYQNGQPVEVTEKEFKPEFTLQYARIFPDRWFHPGSSIVVRFGLKESTGGIGLDYIYNERLMLFSDIWDFGRQDRPQENLKPNTELGFKFFVKGPFFIKLGGYDLLNAKYRSLLIGGGMSFTDNDLKYLMGAMKLPGF